MIKKYKKIGTLLLGLSCLTGGFFTPVENNSLIPTVQAAEKSDKLVCNMTTKELFNVVYGYLREKEEIITFAMPPQSADDYGLITIRQSPVQWKNSSKTATVEGRMYLNFYIDKGASRDFSILNISYYFGDYNFISDYHYHPITLKSEKTNIDFQRVMNLNFERYFRLIHSKIMQNLYFYSPLKINWLSPIYQFKNRYIFHSLMGC